MAGGVLESDGCFMYLHQFIAKSSQAEDLGIGRIRVVTLSLTSPRQDWP
jgi:hypothetical protein